MLAKINWDIGKFPFFRDVSKNIEEKHTYRTLPLPPLFDVEIVEWRLIQATLKRGRGGT